MIIFLNSHFLNVMEDLDTGLAVVVVPPSCVPLMRLAARGGGGATLQGILGGNNNIDPHTKSQI